MQAAGNHQVQHQPEIAFDTNRDALADASQFSNDPSFHTCYRGLHGAQQKRTGQPHLLERVSDDACFKGTDVSRDIGQFRHIGQALALTTLSLGAEFNIGGGEATPYLTAKAFFTGS